MWLRNEWKLPVPAFLMDKIALILFPWTSLPAVMFSLEKITKIQPVPVCIRFNNRYSVDITVDSAPRGVHLLWWRWYVRLVGFAFISFLSFAFSLWWLATFILTTFTLRSIISFSFSTLGCPFSAFGIAADLAFSLDQCICP